MFSEALKIMDQNTVQYMVELQQQQLEEAQNRLAEISGRLEDAQDQLEDTQGRLEDTQGKWMRLLKYLYPTAGSREIQTRRSGSGFKTNVVCREMRPTGQ